MKPTMLFKVAVVWTVFTVQSVSAQMAGNFNSGDMAVIHAMIENNGLKWTKAAPADGSFVPDDWTGIKWSDQAADKRIISLIVQSPAMTNDRNIGEGALTGTFNVSGLTALQYLDCSNNQLTSLDVAGMTHLQTLRCNDNVLTSLNVAGCTNLRNLNCNDNQLSALDVSGLTALRSFNCGWNSLTSLDLTGLTYLISFACPENNLNALNLSGCTGMQVLNCRNNKLTSLNVAACTKLIEFNCTNNSLASLNLTGIDDITLFLGDGQTQKLTLSGSGNQYVVEAAFSNDTTFDHAALTYVQGILRSENNRALTSNFSSPTGLLDYSLTGTLILDYTELRSGVAE